MSIRTIILAALAVTTVQSLCSAQEIPGTGPEFTKAQASEGRRAYREHCATCHGRDLKGVDVIPSLVGDRFDYTWRGKSAQTLMFHLKRMPPESVAEPGSLSNETYTNILAYILRSNGFEPGDVELPSVFDAHSNLTIPLTPGMEIDPFVPVKKTDRQKALLNNYPPATEAVKRNPSDDDWLHWGRTYDMHNFSPLNAINKKNVKDLQLAWRAPLTFGGANPAPLVYQGIMFVYTHPDTVLAMDASNGDILWRYEHPSEGRVNNKMGIALHEDMVIVPTSDLHVVALEAKTGSLIWEHVIPREHPGFELRSAPLVAGDKVLQGVMGILTPKGGFLVALDVETGEESWRFNIIPRPGEPGGNTWNDLPIEQRSGGSMWHQGSYDPDLNLAYFGTAPTYDTQPLMHPIDKEGHTNETLYTNCTLAFNPDTGELVWHYQHMVNDPWDLDWVFERQILDLPVDGIMRRVVFTVGKPAILDALDAATGEFLFAIDMGLQNIVSAIDPETGAKTISPHAIPNIEKPTFLSVNNDGIRNWPSLSYNAETKRLYLPLIETGMQTGTEGYKLTSSEIRFDARPHPDSDGKLGRIQAVDMGGRELGWRYRQSPPIMTSMMATAGGLVFAGDLNRAFMAFDDSTGEILWKTDLDDVPSSNIVSYSVDGRQYVAVVAGMSNYNVRDLNGLYNRFAPELDMPVNDAPKGGAAVWVFALDGLK